MSQSAFDTICIIGSVFFFTFAGIIAFLRCCHGMLKSDCERIEANHEWKYEETKQVP